MLTGTEIGLPGRFETPYFLLDILFLLGDLKETATLLERRALADPVQYNEQTNSYQLDKRAKLNRTSQLLISIGLAMTEIAKERYLCSSSERN